MGRTAPCGVARRRKTKCVVRGPVLQGVDTTSQEDVLWRRLSAMELFSHRIAGLPPQTVVATTLNVTATVPLPPPCPGPPVEQDEGTVKPLAPQLGGESPFLAEKVVKTAA